MPTALEYDSKLMRLIRRLFLPVLALFAMLWQIAAAQTTSAPSNEQSAPTTPVVKARTNLVIVDVVAHDKKGQMISDLAAPDFKVREDGKEQAISVFAFQQPAAGKASATASSEALPPNVFRNAPRFNSNSSLNVILLDAMNSNLLNQAYVRTEMVKFLEQLPQGQPIAIYALGRKLRLLQDFTTDLNELKRIIQAFKGESSHFLASPTGTPEVPLTLAGWADQMAKEFAPEIRTQIQNFAQETGSDQMDIRIEHTMAALASLAHMLAGRPGRKNLIWITESVPVHMFATNYQPVIEQQGSQLAKVLPDGQSDARTRRSYDDQLAMVSNLFADAQVAVYPVDARGLVGSEMFNVARNLNGLGANGAMAVNIDNAQKEELFEAHTSMSDIAEKTGGKAYYNHNNIAGAVRDDMEDGATYYTIGYYPQNKSWDGRFRKIQISAARSGVKLRYRLGYFAFDRAEYGKDHPKQSDMDFGQALDPNSPMATALQFEVAVLPPGEQTKIVRTNQTGQTGDAAGKVLIRFAIDPHQINFDAGLDGLEHGEVDCAARAFSPKDVEHPVTTEAARIEARLKPEVYEKINRTWFPCQITLDLPNGSYLLRLAVRDNVTGLIGSLNAQVVVTKALPPSSH